MEIAEPTLNPKKMRSAGRDLARTFRDPPFGADPGVGADAVPVAVVSFALFADLTAVFSLTALFLTGYGVDEPDGDRLG